MLSVEFIQDHRALHEDGCGSGNSGQFTETRGNGAVRKFFTGAFLWCLLAVLMILGAYNLGQLRKYNAVSLRYETPVSGQSAYQARQFSARRGGDAFWPTFWHEAEAEFTGDHRTVKAPCITFSGDASLVWPVQYLAGSAPGAIDGAGCAVSAGLAMEIWGGADVVGMHVTVDGETRIVRGVFDGAEMMALLSVMDEDKGHSFTAIELSGGPSHPVRDDAVSYAAAAGLGVPDRVLTGTPESLASAAAALPLLILAVYTMILCAGYIKKRRIVYRSVLFALAIGFALILPVLLAALPDWAIPARWSDFSFWGSLTAQVWDDILQYLALTPRTRDIVYFVLLLKQAGLLLLSAVLAVSVCFRHRAITGNRV